MINNNNQRQIKKRIETIIKALNDNVLPMTVEQIFEATNLSKNIIYNMLKNSDLTDLTTLNQKDNLKLITYQLNANGHCFTEGKDFIKHVQNHSWCYSSSDITSKQSLLVFFYNVTTARVSEIYC